MRGFRTQTHCVHGHEFTEENTRWYKGSYNSNKFYRMCVACHLKRERLRYRHDDGYRSRQRKQGLANYYKRQEKLREER